MSIFNINGSKQPKNKIRIKHDENILSSSDTIQNSSPNSPYYYLEFLNYIGLILGKVTNKAYYPIFSLGAFVDPGNSYGLSTLIRKFTEEFFTKTDPALLDVDPLGNLDFSSIPAHMEATRLQNEQIYLETVLNYNSNNTVDLFFQILSEYDLDPEMKEILSYQNWNSPEPA
jgi:hypothetical protein